jgi:hypothetical protein
MDIYLTLIPFKTCTCCGVSKEISLFHKNRKAKDGLQSRCKDCGKAEQKARYQANPEKAKARAKAYYQADPEKQKARVKARYQANPEKVKAQIKAWKKANPEKEKAYDKARYQANKDDPCFKVMMSQGDRISKALKGIKMAAPAKELVGGSWETLVAHLESKFEDWMTWENHGSWHIDHIKPCSSFDFNDPQQQYECFHWTNTQPLRASENRSKGSKVQ